MILYTSSDSVVQLAAHDSVMAPEALYGACGAVRELLRGADAVRPQRVEVHGVGKAPALFAGTGFSAAHPGASNEEALASIERLIDELDTGLVFANLIETDQLYGHRKDAPGFHQALRRFDAALARWLPRQVAAHSDHTREHAPLLARFTGDGGRRHDGPLADVGASVLDWLTAQHVSLPGRSFIADA